ncbi:OmpA family protein [Granulosicoccaceae sp. 1_MG-2023]|nr:OmpA family protein [Granulosicoccaceae sp. 1_MG-2023]
MKLRLISQAVALSLMCGAMPLHADEFNDRFYIGLGAGLSQLEPGTKNTGYYVDDKSDFGYKLYAGWDFAKRWSAELYYDDLGEAVLKNDFINNQGDVGYKLYGLQALYHFYNNRGTDGLMARHGWDFFGKLGVGSLSNDTDLPYKKEHKVHASLGLGTEYEWANGFAVRAEAETYDDDIQFYSLGLLKRFGGATPAPVVVPEPVVEEEPQVEVAPTPEPVVVAPSDSDNDGVIDELDQCPDTAPGMQVNEQGCDVFNAVLEGVQFATDSAELTAESRGILNDAAATLSRFPSVRIAVMAHTDNVGAAEYNMQLSKRRAASVVRYLMEQGIDGDRLRPEAYGESQPRATNATPEGRYANRRVEFREIK